MTLPATLLGLIYALLLGSLFHVWRDGGPLRLLLYLILSVAGAAAGQWIGTALSWTLFSAGGLNLAAATAGSVVFLAIGYWLSLVEIHRDEEEKHKV
jgi:uncharacterized membrane protein YeaQ/YmgE (transglycosylase-associated protein family)